jgi:predicted kinase
MLIIFGGLPATGKSTVSRAVARKLGAAHLRVDTIEQGLRDAGMSNIGPTGYILAYRIAADNLELGLTVVAESVNPIAITRDAWRAVGKSSGVQVIEIETICSDQSEHQQRVESRAVNIQGLRLPTWKDVQNRDYEAWSNPRVVIDTAGETAEQSITRTIKLISEQRSSWPLR